jgi:tetratricopeptide (TPR) repeat protein
MSPCHLRAVGWGRGRELVVKAGSLKLIASLAVALLLGAGLACAATDAGNPLNRVQILGLIEGGVSNRRVEGLIKERGIDFEPAPQYVQMLREAGADEALITVLRSATAPASERPAVKSRQPGPQAISADPNPQLNRAHAFADEGKWAEAVAEYRAALQADPNNTLALNGLGMALARAGDLDGAIEQYRRALGTIQQDHGTSGLAPEVATVHDNLGVALRKKGDMPGAVSEFRKAVEAEPRNSHAHANLGLTLEAENDLDGALGEYQTALKFDGSCCQAQYNIGRILEMKGDLEAAIATFQTALAARPNDPLAHYGLGTALERKGDQQNALEQYRLAARLAPSDATIEAAYARLQQDR